MTKLNINQQIASLRKQKGITQEDLAGHLGVTNQSVSKWELAACCPDIQLLPAMADYFNVTIDELFGRVNTAVKKEITIDSVPWDDDETIRAVIFIGKKIMDKTDDLTEFTFTYDGEAKNVESRLSIQCHNIHGNAEAGANITCNNINNNANAGCDINSKNIIGNAEAGCDINSDNIGNNATAGCDITCTTIDGAVSAGGGVNCATINGSVSAGGNINHNT